jgi:hypothetical protein
VVVVVVVALFLAKGWVGTPFQTGRNKIMSFGGQFIHFGFFEAMFKTLLSHWLACVVG